jgi:hypothetical protein
MNIPDPKKHLIISLIKSSLRITGSILLWKFAPLVSAIFLISEALGIYEELV